MKAVLISIRPMWVELIASGKKTVEVRKTRPKIEPPFKCYIYETQGRTDEPWMDEDGNMDFRGRGAVVGEFKCNVIFPISVYASDASFFDTEPPLSVPGTCLTDKEIAEYLGIGKTGYGWHISDLVIYDNPKKLSEFGINRPPQSWCYAEEVV